ncbi:MAG TPA: DUF1028 domain-containing protein [Longimicrobium sp.]|nr:DUF1028 domain-containing protein [Longimicrobium sp.]
MPSLRRALIAAALLLPLVPRTASATWSIVVLDRTRGWIGVAAASCTPDVYGIMRLMPGRGVLIAQAAGNDAAIQRASDLLARGVAPDSVLRAITASAVDARRQDRQYAIAALDGGSAQFTGAETAGYHGHRSAPDVLVQGNSLPGPEVLDRAMAAIHEARTARRPLDEVLMAGLAAGSRAGGDVRCGIQRATSAFLTVARPGERPFLPYLTLSVIGAEPGTVNAVDVLQSRLTRWQTTGGRANRITQEGVQPSAADSAPQRE